MKNAINKKIIGVVLVVFLLGNSPLAKMSPNISKYKIGSNISMAWATEKGVYTVETIENNDDYTAKVTLRGRDGSYKEMKYFSLSSSLEYFTTVHSDKLLFPAITEDTYEIYQFSGEKGELVWSSNTCFPCYYTIGVSYIYPRTLFIQYYNFSVVNFFVQIVPKGFEFFDIDSRTSIVKHTIRENTTSLIKESSINLFKPLNTSFVVSYKNQTVYYLNLKSDVFKSAQINTESRDIIDWLVFEGELYFLEKNGTTIISSKYDFTTDSLTRSGSFNIDNANYSDYGIIQTEEGMIFSTYKRGEYLDFYDISLRNTTIRNSESTSITSTESFRYIRFPSNGDFSALMVEELKGSYEYTLFTTYSYSFIQFPDERGDNLEFILIGAGVIALVIVVSFIVIKRRKRKDENIS